MSKKERARAAVARTAQKTRSMQRTAGEYAGALAARRFGLQDKHVGPVPVGVVLGLLGAWMEYKRGATASTPMQLAIGAAKVQGPIAVFARGDMASGILDSFGGG